MAKKEVTNDEILQALNQFANQVNERFDSVESDNVKLRDDMNNGFDRIAARLDDDDTERGALESLVNRHERWIHRLADSTNTELSA